MKIYAAPLTQVSHQAINQSVASSMNWSNLPQSHDVRKREFPLEDDEQPSEAEVHVAGVMALKVVGQLRVNE